MIHTGDCLKVMRGMEADSVDAIVTDPPYGLEFMGKGWDKFGAVVEHPDDGEGPWGRTARVRYAAGHSFQAWCEAWGRAALRVTKPGGYLLAFGGTRTHHRLVCGLEDAGWIIRDELTWVYACLSDDTEILTGRGWLRYNEVSTNDTALAFDSASGSLQWEPIEAVHQYHHEGDMVRLHGAGTDQLVTLNHRLVLVDGPGVDQVPGVRDGVLASRGMAAPGVQGTVLLEAMQRDATYPRSSVSSGAVMDRRAESGVGRADARLQELGVEGRRYRVQKARELLWRSVRAGTAMGSANGPQGRLHHGASATDGSLVWVPDDQGRSRQPREPRPNRQPPRESDVVALEPGSQAVRVEQAGDAWRLVPTPATAQLVDYAGVVWCVTVPSGAFVARRRGIAFVTGNSGFPKGKANLKPAHEPIVLARKPGPLRPLAIDACRIGAGEWVTGGGNGRASIGGGYGSGITKAYGTRPKVEPHNEGRWPSNVLLSDPALFDEPNPEVVGSGAVAGAHGGPATRSSQRGEGWGLADSGDSSGHGDSGGYSRFFIIPKADRADREPIRAGSASSFAAQVGGSSPSPASRLNAHPTVKPTDLMRHLVRLVTPPGGTVLDCFAGSGSTLIAAELEGFEWIGIEQDPSYVAIAEARLNGTQRGLGLDVPAPTKAPPKTHPDLSKHQPTVRAAADNYSGGWIGTEDDVA